MINILSPDKKRDIRAARINVVLARYSIAIVLLSLLSVLIYGVGYAIISQEKTATLVKLESQSTQSKAYAQVQSEADSFRNNLAVAKKILKNETSYSRFLTSLAAGLPSGTVLTQLSVGNNTTAQANGMLVEARTSNYDKVLELKNSLEQTDLFENVRLVSTSRPNDITKLVELEARYPYKATYNVTLTTAKVAQ